MVTVMQHYTVTIKPKNKPKIVLGQVVAPNVKEAAIKAYEVFVDAIIDYYINYNCEATLSFKAIE